MKSIENLGSGLIKQLETVVNTSLAKLGPNFVAQNIVFQSGKLNQENYSQLTINYRFKNVPATGSSMPQYILSVDKSAVSELVKEYTAQGISSERPQIEIKAEANL